MTNQIQTIATNEEYTNRLKRCVVYLMHVVIYSEIYLEGDFYYSLTQCSCEYVLHCR